MSARPRAKNASYTPDSTQKPTQSSLQYSVPPVPSQNIYSINSYFDFQPHLGTFVPFPLENNSIVEEIESGEKFQKHSPKKL